MKYIVMECHYSYAILLDEEGRFVKAANLHYEVGETVTDIVEMKDSPVKRVNKRMNTILAIAIACFVFMITSYINHRTYASVFMVINPEVRIDVNRKNMVVGLEGVNADGVRLIRNYSYQKKSLEPVMDELVDRAIEMGYLSDGKQVTLTLDAQDSSWIDSNEERLQSHVNEYVADKITIEIEINVPSVLPESEETIYKESDYTDSSAGESPADETPVNDSPAEEISPEPIIPPEPVSAQDSVSIQENNNLSYDQDDGSDDGASSYEVSNYDDHEDDDDDDYDDDDDDNYDDDDDDSDDD